MCSRNISCIFLILSLRVVFVSLKLPRCLHALPMEFSLSSSRITSHIYCLMSICHLWGNCPVFTIIQQAWNYRAFRYYFLFVMKIFSCFVIYCLAFERLFFKQGRLLILMSHLLSLKIKFPNLLDFDISTALHKPYPIFSIFLHFKVSLTPLNMEIMGK